MRIRTIKPEFWRSRSISCLSLEDRLLFIGLWSYVDDNGVGLDRVSNIAADLFADDVERDPRETFARVSRGLATLSAAGRITRFTCENHDFIAISGWGEHQRIDRPAKPRYPDLTSPNVTIRETLARSSRDPRDWNRGTGEQGNRGTGEKTCSPAASSSRFDAGFDAWWAQYPRKVGKGQARKALAKALTKIDLDALIDATKQFANRVRGSDPKFIPHPATWLNGERWDDQPDQPVISNLTEAERDWYSTSGHQAEPNPNGLTEAELEWGSL